jgi:tetratricopeptide (TPR) repeat protein
LPSSPVACNTYGVLLSVLGRHAEAIALAERSLELNPNDPNACWYAFQLGYAGDYETAAVVFKKALADRPTDALYRGWLAFMEIALGNLDAAIEQVEISERLATEQRLITFLTGWAYTYSRADGPEDAARIFAEILGAAEKGAQPGAGGWALAYLAIGDRERALNWLKTAADKAANHEPDEGFYNLLGLKMNLTNDPVLKEPEFVEVLSRIRGD